MIPLNNLSTRTKIWKKLLPKPHVPFKDKNEQRYCLLKTCILSKCQCHFGLNIELKSCKTTLNFLWYSMTSSMPSSNKQVHFVCCLELITFAYIVPTTFKVIQREITKATERCCRGNSCLFLSKILVLPWHFRIYFL